jgi:hypothetical protein
VLEAAAAVGLPTVRFNEGTTVTDGAGIFQINRLPHWTRALVGELPAPCRGSAAEHDGAHWCMGIEGAVRWPTGHGS